MIKSIKVGGLKFKVKEATDLITRDGQEALGGVIHHKQIIYIDPDQTKNSKRVTLLHEIGHTILARAGLETVLPAETQEQLCDVFGYAFLDLVRDNPKLIRYLND